MEFNHEFVVADHITAEAILGLDFLEANKCVLDLSKQEMTIKNEVLELKPSPANAIVQQQCATVTVMNTIVVPPSSEMEFMAHMNTQGNGTWLLESIKCSIGQYTGSTLKPRYFCHTDCNSKISLYRLKLLNS